MSKQSYYQDGAYLLILPGENDGQVCVIKNNEGAHGIHALVVTMTGGITVLSNLPDDAKLYAMAVITDERMEALRHAVGMLLAIGDSLESPDVVRVAAILKSMYLREN